MKDGIEEKIAKLGPWFHNMVLDGALTAPNHFLGDYPQVKFVRFADAIPQDLTGKAVLDIGCNGGFYSLEMKRRGAARVLGIDTDEHYLRQARFAAEVRGLEVEFRRMPVWDVAALGERFDLVIFMGVLYHLRHPLLALDLIHEHVAKDLLLFQSMQRGSRELIIVQEDYEITAPVPFDDAGLSEDALHRAALLARCRRTGGCRTAPAWRRCCARPASRSSSSLRKRCMSAGGSR